MKCPQCTSLENKVIDSRMNQMGDLTRRRRECLKCGNRFTTYERLEPVMPMVVKKDGRREEFNREKIFLGIQKACQKRAITTNQVEKMVNEIEKKISSWGLQEIPSERIGQVAMIELHHTDKVAYVRFASVYREFRDVEEFVEEIKDWFPSLQNNKTI